MAANIAEDQKPTLKSAQRQSYGLVATAFVFSVFVNLLMLTGPLFMLQVYDRVLGSRSEETLVALLLLVVFLYSLMWLLDFARTRLLARHGARIQVALDKAVFEVQINHPTLVAPGRSLSRDLQTVQNHYASPVVPALMDVPFTPLFIGAIFIFHPMMGWMALAGAVVLIAITSLNQRLTARRLAAAQSKIEQGDRFADAALSAREIILSQGMVAPVTDRFLGHRFDGLVQSMTAVDWTGAFSSFTKALRLLLQSLILALGAWLVLGGQITAGAMIAASILLGRALAPVEQLIGRWPQLVQMRTARRSLHDALKAAPASVERTRLPRPAGLLEVSNLTVLRKPGAPPVLSDVSFRVAPGEALGVIGKSGSGKTSIAKTVLGLLQPALGEVRLGQALIAHYADEDLGAHIGYLPQEPVLINGTIAENIARMALRPKSSAVVAAAQKAMAHDLILGLPDGYDTMVDGGELALSGGQRQRIALARALYGDPVLLVLDEPNSALDQDGSDALNAAIRTMKSEGRSVLIMTHRPFAISECDRLMVVDGGAVKAIGPRDHIIRTRMRNADDIQRSLHAAAGR